jgi:uncharacterized protein YfkK (UPF0435 family)
MEKEYISKESVIKEIKRKLRFVENRILRNESYDDEAIAAWNRDETLYKVYQDLLSFTIDLPVIKI